MQILKMLEAGQITAEEAARLLDALKGFKGTKKLKTRIVPAGSECA